MAGIVKCICDRPKKIDSYIGHGFWVAVGPERQPIKLKVLALSVHYNEYRECKVTRLRLSNGKWYEVNELFASKKDFYAAQRQMLEQRKQELRLCISIESEKVRKLERRLKNVEEQERTMNRNGKNC